MDFNRKFVIDILKKQIVNRGMYWDRNISANTYEPAAQLYWDDCIENGAMTLNKVRIPDIRNKGMAWTTWPCIYADSIMIHHLFFDNYSFDNVCMIENLLMEGTYGYENVKVEPGDVVIDAGAYIGDWSAVASAMGGEVYAFDPSPKFRDILYETARLNNFTPVHFGLADKEATAHIDTKGGVGSDTIRDEGEECTLTTVDIFAERMGKKIGFIKSDIEGFERYMLRGATRVLQEDCPKLAIRTYHSKEDPKLLESIILEANPNYKVIQRVRTLYAYVP